jgi:hypothetical protein
MDPEPLLSRPVDVVLHIGTGKTGTSSVQFFLRDNRDHLSQRGFLYPRTPGNARHGRLVLFASPDDELSNYAHWPRQRQSDPAMFRRVFRRRLIREIEEAGLPRLLLSDEELYKASEPTLRRLGRFTGRIARELRVVCYLRRQDEHMVSRYQQGVKTGWVSRLDDFSRQDMSDLYDYAGRLGRHRRLLSPTAMVVRRFERDAFVGGSLRQDFLDAAGVDARADEMVQSEDRNLSLDAESVEFLRLLNLHRVENEGATPGLVDNRALVSTLAAASTGPTLTLPDSVLDRFMATWRDTNQRVAVDYLGDKSGQLFRQPRRTAHTTTEQRLDPARLERYVTLVGLPEELHEPLRRIAEREAVRAGGR